jgi:sulfite reductase alpha subunit-like flavoprotein
MPSKVLTNVKIFYSCAKDQAGVGKTISMRAHEFLVSYNLVERSVTPKSLNDEIPPELFLTGSICIFFISPSNTDGDTVNNLEAWLKRILLDQGAGHRIRLDGLRYAIFSIDAEAAELNRCLKQLGARNIIHMGEGKSEPDDLLDISFREWMMDLVILLRSYTFIINHPPPAAASKSINVPNLKVLVELESEEDKENTGLLNS